MLASLKVLRNIDISYIEVSWDLVNRATAYSLKTGVSPYNAVYVLAAKDIRAQLVTADKRPYNALKDEEPSLLYLGDYPRPSARASP